MKPENLDILKIPRRMISFIVVLVVLQFILLFATVDPVEAQMPPAWCSNETTEFVERERINITNVVLSKLAIRIDREGNPNYVAWCRTDHNDRDYTCEQNIEAIVKEMVIESVYRKIDPWLISSMIWKETRFSAFAVGQVGERGVMQLHPRNSRFRNVRFLHGPEYYRRRCANELGLCQREVIIQGISLIADSIERCGSIRQGLTMYNTGRCEYPRNRYARTVLSIQQDFQETLEENVYF